MPVPKAVQQQADAADAMLKAAVEGQCAPDPSTFIPQGEAPAIPPDTVPQDDPNSETWKQRYLSLKGKYDKEVKDLPIVLQENTDLRRRLDQANAALSASNDLTRDLQAKIEEAKKAPETPSRPSVLTPEEEAKLKAEFGDEHFQLMNKLILNAVSRQVEEAKADVQKVAKAETQQDRRARFEKDVMDGVDHCNIINHDRRFLSWLDQPEDLSGEKRSAILNRHVKTMNAAHVIKIFSAFVKETGWTPPGAVSAQPSPPASGTQPPARDLASEIVPSPSAASAAQDPGNQAAALARKWTPEAMQRYYADVSRGAYRGREKLAKQLSDEIDFVLSQRQGQPVTPSPAVAKRGEFGAVAR